MSEVEESASAQQAIQLSVVPSSDSMCYAAHYSMTGQWHTVHSIYYGRAALQDFV